MFRRIELLLHLICGSEMLFEERYHSGDILLAILEVRFAVISVRHHPHGFGFISSVVKQGCIMRSNDLVAFSMDEQEWTQGQFVNRVQWLDLVEMVSSTQLQ